MSLEERVRATQEGVAPYRGKLEWIKERLEPEDAEGLDRLIADPNVPPAAIWKELLSLGFEITERGVNYWCRQARAGRG